MVCRQYINRKSAVLLIAAIQFVHGFGTFLSASVAMKHATQLAFLGVLIASAMNMWLALILCVGVNAKKTQFIIIWLAWAAVVLMLFVISVPILALYSYTISQQFKQNFAATFLMYILSFVLHCLFVHIVYGYYEEVVLGKREEERESFRNETEDGNGAVVVSTIKTNDPASAYHVIPV